MDAGSYTGIPTFTDYNYTDYEDDQLCNKSAIIKFGAVVTPVFLWIVTLLSLFGNSLVLVILMKYENLRSLTNIFILNLALSDLLFTFGLPFWASYHIHGWTFGEVACQAVIFLFYTGFYSSIMFLTIMTIHRYLAVVHPLSDLGSKRLCYGSVTSSIVWIVSCLAAVPALVMHRVNKLDGKSYCDYADTKWKIGGIYQQNILFLLALSVFTFCYVKILGTLLRSRSHTRYRTVKLIFTIAVLFFLGWAPYNVLIFLKSLTEMGTVWPFAECSVSKGIDFAFYICRLIAFSHCCLNPVFYVFVGVKFRSHLKKLLKKLWFCQTTVLDIQHRSSRAILSNGEELSLY
ncbi:chemokine (C motif) receptor 1a, duplicate 1 [Brienomyrus brachyistius]|uniref:chemokine (C motif) receptor 1a, duplicate 1 n=1 Tax=Brienomyrus brachyistius TaxID=42636 RepID=UPI0020B23F41|nr:chemokine (C motif) receptor 1a, duplicate 1 [Brienomyrus brachyistius]